MTQPKPEEGTEVTLAEDTPVTLPEGTELTTAPPQQPDEPDTYDDSTGTPDYDA